MGKRRPNGDGMVRKRTDGRWEGRLVIGHKQNGLPIYKTVLAKTQKDLTEKLNQFKEAYKGADLTEEYNITLSDWLDKWLNEIICLTVRKSTLDGYRGYINRHVKPYLGDKPIAFVTTADIQKLYNKVKAEGRIKPDKDGSRQLGDSTVRSVHMTLHEAMDAAVREKIIIRNPTEGTVIPKANHKPMQPFNNEQLEKFFSAIKDEPQWHDIFYVDVTTGLRRGEICGLKWEDYDAQDGTLKIKRSLSSVNHGLIQVGETKTENGVRTIYLPPSTAEVLNNRQMTAVSEWIFPNFFLPELPINPSTVYTKFKSILKEHDLPDIRFHDLRHTFATQAIASGVDPKTLSEIIGHSDASFTLDRYAHVTTDMQNNAAEIVGNFITDILTEVN